MSRTRFYRLTPDGVGTAAALKAGMLVAGQASGDPDVTLDLETGRLELVEWLVGAAPAGTALGLELELRTTDPRQALTTLGPLAEHCFLRQDPPPAWQDLVHDDLSWHRREQGRIEVSFALPIPPTPKPETRRVLAQRLTLAARAGLIDGVDFRTLVNRFLAEYGEVKAAPDPVGEGDVRFFGGPWCAGHDDGTMAPAGIGLDLPGVVAERLGGLAGMFEQGTAVRVNATLGDGDGAPRLTELKALDLGDGSLRATITAVPAGGAGDELLTGLVSRLDGDRITVSWQCAFKGAQPDTTGVLLQDDRAFGPAGGSDAAAGPVGDRDGAAPELWLCLDGGTANSDGVAARLTKAAGVTLERSDPEGGD